VGVAEWDRVRRVLLRLGPDDRELLMLVGWDGLTPGDAADVIGISPSTARMRLSRARARFRALWCDAEGQAGHVVDVLPPLVTGEPR
jgi:RNA polymerase sigma-70 factor (ECF subfamily)